jgi:hypothetical protein
VRGGGDAHHRPENRISTPGQIPGPAWELANSVALEPVAFVLLAPFISAISAAAAAAAAAAAVAAAAAAAAAAGESRCV